MHPQWQARQASQIDGEYHVDHCAVFSSHTSGCIWCLFFSLVCWITIHKYGITDLLHYIDDAFNAVFTDKCILHQPYNQLMPVAQARFLQILDDIGLPHEDAKQLHGNKLEIISFEVDLLKMTIRIPPESKQKLVISI